MHDEIQEQLQQIEDYLEACEIIHEIETQLIEEKKTREEYVKKKFYKNHDYDKDTGTIDIDGTRVYVDDDPRKNIRGKKVIVDPRTNEPILTPDGKKQYDKRSLQYFTGPSMSSNEGSAFYGNPTDKPTLHLDKTFWKLKSQKQRNAVLTHEITHPLKHFNPDKMTKDVFDSLLKQALASHEVKNTQRMRNIPDDIMKYLLIHSLENKYGVKYSDLCKKYDPNSDRSKDYERYNKYVTKTGSAHSAPTEIEADEEAVKKYGKSDAKRGILNVTKNLTRANNEVHNALINTPQANAILKLPENKGRKKYLKANARNAHTEINRNAATENMLRSRAIKDYNKKQK